jgi:hypothetical protein
MKGMVFSATALSEKPANTQNGRWEGSGSHGTAASKILKT